jgi:hypothetical protein
MAAVAHWARRSRRAPVRVARAAGGGSELFGARSRNRKRRAVLHETFWLVLCWIG